MEINQKRLISMKTFARKIGHINNKDNNKDNKKQFYSNCYKNIDQILIIKFIIIMNLFQICSFSNITLKIRGIGFNHILGYKILVLNFQFIYIQKKFI